MKTKNKIIGLVMVAVLLVTASVYGTMAYLTSQDEVVNTFTVGSVRLSLDELDSDNDSNTDDNVTTNDGLIRDKANIYHLVPGYTYVKDPTVHVAAGSEDCYVFVVVDNQIADIESEHVDANEAAGIKGYKTIAEQMEENGWNLLDGTTNVYVYEDNDTQQNIVVVNSVNNTDLVVFKEFKIDGESVINGTTEADGAAPEGQYRIGDYASQKDGTDVSIIVTAYAVQSDGFDTAAMAWNATFGAQSK